jgi:integrase
VPDELWVAIQDASWVTLDDRLWLGLGYYCGLRLAEMVTLQPHAVRSRDHRIDPGTLHFFRKGSKKDDGIAYAAILDILGDPDIGLPDLARHGGAWMDLLESTASFRHDQMFLLPSSVGRLEADSHYVWRRFRAIQKKLGVPKEDLVSPHNMRHSAATNLALCDVDAAIIQRQLSHSSADITAHYTGKAAQRLVRWTEQRRRNLG